MRRAVGKVKRSCRGKRRYHDATQAKAALRAIRSHSTRDTVPHRAYFCPRCKGWHLTSKEYRP